MLVLCCFVETYTGQRDVRGYRAGQGTWTKKIISGVQETVRATYRGPFIDDFFHGKGYYHYGTFVHFGWWQNGCKNGEGSISDSSCADSCIVDGKWDIETFNGEDRSNPLYVYTGTIVKGKRENSGTQVFANGDKTVAEWKDGLKNGRGTITFVNGNLLECEFKDDKRVYGKMSYANHPENIISYEGHWKDKYTSDQWMGCFYHGRGKLVRKLPSTDKEDIIVGLFWFGQCPDFSILVGKDGEEVDFRVHESALCSISPVFMTMFKSPMAEADTRVMRLDHKSPKVVRAVLKYLYLESHNQLLSRSLEDTLEILDFIEYFDLRGMSLIKRDLKARIRRFRVKAVREEIEEEREESAREMKPSLPDNLPGR